MSLQQYTDRRVLITGANGFIGTYIAEALHAVGTCVYGVGLGPAPFASGIHPESGDLRDAGFITRVVNEFDPEYVFHLAAFKERTAGLPAFRDSVEINLLGSLNLFAALLGRERLRAIVAIGTAEEYGNNAAPFLESMREAPVTAYSFSKTCVSHLALVLHRIYKLPTVVLRPTLVYGPRQQVDMFLPALIRSLLNGEPFAMTQGQQTREFIYVTDLVDAMIQAAVTPEACGQILNIGGGDSVKVGDLALYVERLLGMNGLVQLGALPYRPSEVLDYAVSTTKARTIIGWKPKVKMEDGLKRTIEFYRSVVIAQ